MHVEASSHRWVTAGRFGHLRQRRTNASSMHRNALALVATGSLIILRNAAMRPRAASHDCQSSGRL